MGVDIGQARRLGFHISLGAGYHLRPLGTSDFDSLLSMLQTNPDASWERTAPSVEYVRTLIDFRLEHYERFGFGVLAVENSAGRLVGQAGLQVFNVDRDMLEVVIFLASAETGKGLGSRALAAISMQAYSCDIACLYAAIRLDNFSARRFFSSRGFELIGRDVHYAQVCGIWRRLVVPPTS
ncbi:GNAT family N-acetyltransferase [Micromonospora arida]|uniref:GNAT family N-acetyltransferase n=1 Tax=Micromonospora arida TaxID=2203715 RepID=UPI0033B2D25B